MIWFVLRLWWLWLLLSLACVLGWAAMTGDVGDEDDPTATTTTKAPPACEDLRNVRPDDPIIDACADAYDQ